MMMMMITTAAVLLSLLLCQVCIFSFIYVYFKIINNDDMTWIQ
jgi:hypothetical protein